jgi:hypothetical protein
VCSVVVSVGCVLWWLVSGVYCGGYCRDRKSDPRQAKKLGWVGKRVYFGGIFWFLLSTVHSVFYSGRYSLAVTVGVRVWCVLWLLVSGVYCGG